MSRLLWTAILSGAALAHVVVPTWFVAYYPSYLPWPELAISGSAFVEVLLAALLWNRRTERIGFIGIALLMLMYMPVHVYVITHHDAIVNPPVAIPLWLAWVRLPMQLVLIAWAYRLGRR
ncbi:MAG: hypothetical protein FGM24_00655 [Candidatus Kapabacteria bacterium]|nr:hypothetical protein [Candidatus Kapabacteria bacterium]